MQGALMGNVDPRPDAIVNTSSRLSAQQHLHIYRRSYTARLRECMQAQFSALAYALGPGLFTAFADDYLVTYPSESYTLNELGKRFPAFLQETRPDANEPVKEQWPDFMIELAAFEFALAQVFDEPEASACTTAVSTTADELLTPGPILHLFAHTHPVCTYYLQVTHGHKPDLPLPADTWCAVVRVNYKLGLFQLSAGQYALLALVQKFGNITEALPHFFAAGYSHEQFTQVWPAWKKYFTDSALLVQKAQQQFLESTRCSTT